MILKLRTRSLVFDNKIKMSTDVIKWQQRYLWKKNKAGTTVREVGHVSELIYLRQLLIFNLSYITLLNFTELNSLVSMTEESFLVPPKHETTQWCTDIKLMSLQCFARIYSVYLI